MGFVVPEDIHGECKHEIKELETQLAEKEVFVCPECQHMFPYQNLGCPCPHCCIEELEAKLAKIRALEIDIPEHAGATRWIRWRLIKEILGDEEGE